MRRIVCAVGLLVLLTGTWAAGQDTRPARVDERLDQTVTLSEPRVTLDSLLRKASEQTGVVLRADPEAKAWKVRELPLSVEVADMKLSEFQEQLADLLDLRWLASGKASEPEYTIWQDANARDREAAAAQSDDAQKVEKLAARWDATSDKMREASQMTPKELEEAAREDPFLGFVSGTQFGRAYGGLVAGLSGAALPSIAAGKDVRIPFDRLPAAMKDSAQQLFAGMRNLDSMFRNKETEAFAGDWSKVVLKVSPVPGAGVHQPADLFGFLGIIHFEGTGLSGLTDFPIMDPEGMMGEFVARAVTRVEAGESGEAIIADMRQQLMARWQQTQDPLPGEAEREAAEEPLLARSVEIKPVEASTAAVLLGEFADKTKINVVAEGWSHMGAKLEGRKASAAQILVAASKGLNLDWTFERPNTVRLKAPDWAARRARMIPEADFQQWLEIAKSDEGLGPGHLAEMSSIYSEQQIADLMIRDAALRRSMIPLMTGREAVEFYGHLTSSDIRMAGSQRGLPARSLSRDQRASFSPLLTSWGLGPDEFYVDGARIVIQKRDNDTVLRMEAPPDRSREVTIARRPAQQTSPGEGRR